MRIGGVLFLWVTVLTLSPLSAAKVDKGGSQSEKGKAAPKAEPTPSGAQEEVGQAQVPADPISFAGIWMAGPSEDWERRFPVAKDLVMTRRVLTEDAVKSFQLSQQLLGDLRKVKKEGGGRIVDALADEGYVPRADKGAALVMACVLNHEYYFTRTVGRGKGAVTQLLVEVAFDLVICDFSSLSVVASFPWRIERIDVLNGGASAASAAKKQLLQIYTGLDNPTKWFSQQSPVIRAQAGRQDELAGTLREAFVNISKVPLKTLGFEKVAVRKVNIMPDASSVLHEYFKPFAESYFATMFNSSFFVGTSPRGAGSKGNEVIKGTGVACLPFSKGNEVVYSMLVEELADAFRVKVRGRNESDSKNVAFSLGRPHYDIDLVIPAFQTVVASSNEIGQGVQYCAYSRIEVKVDDQPLYSSQHSASQTSIIPAGSPKTTAWESYADATQLMFLKAGEEMVQSKVLDGPDVQKTKPVQIIKPGPLRNFFLLCAPDSLKSTKTKP